jgi:Membrane bound beta barrel domain (DUF5777)
MTNTAMRTLFTLTLSLLLSLSAAGYAQNIDDGDDRALKLAEPDFSLISLPTSLRLPVNGSAFHLTHRFTRPLSCDLCPNSLAADAFGMDFGARIGLEYRYGILPNAEIGVHRASDKTIELFGQYGFLRQGKSSPIEASALLAVDWSDVGRSGVDSQSQPAFGVVVSRRIGERAAVYVQPIWIHNANIYEPSTPDHDTFMTGFGARVRVLDTVYLVGEYAPRAGYAPGPSHGGFGVEKRAGGHVFQLNFTDSFASTLGQLARGGTRSPRLDGSEGTDWYLGFNLTRKFY